jgi:ABC-type enterochelin transport system ATPase subunit
MSAQIRDTVSSVIHEVRYVLSYAAAVCVKHTVKLVQEDFPKHIVRNDVLRPVIVKVR